MGHYRVDFACEVCHNTRCTCPSKPEADPNSVMLESGITLGQWRKQYRDIVLDKNKAVTPAYLKHLRISVEMQMMYFHEMYLKKKNNNET